MNKMQKVAKFIDHLKNKILSRQMAVFLKGRRLPVNITIGGKGSFTNGKTLNVDITTEEAENLNKAEITKIAKFKCYHEASHVRFTDNAEYEHCVRAMTQVITDEAFAQGKRLNGEMIYRFCYRLLNAMCDGRIENLLLTLLPGLKALRDWVRLREWQKGSTKGLTPLQIVSNNILAISTLGIYSKGFEEEYPKGTMLREIVDKCIDPISDYVTSDTIAEGEKAAMKVVDMIKDIVIENFENMNVNQIPDWLKKMIEDALKGNENFNRDKSTEEVKNGPTIGIITDDSEESEGDNENGEQPDIIIDLRTKKPEKEEDESQESDSDSEDSEDEGNTADNSSETQSENEEGSSQTADSDSEDSEDEDNTADNSSETQSENEEGSSQTADSDNEDSTENASSSENSSSSERSSDNEEDSTEMPSQEEAEELFDETVSKEIKPDSSSDEDSEEDNTEANIGNGLGEEDDEEDSDEEQKASSQSDDSSLGDDSENDDEHSTSNEQNNPSNESSDNESSDEEEKEQSSNENDNSSMSSSSSETDSDSNKDESEEELNSDDDLSNPTDEYDTDSDSQSEEEMDSSQETFEALQKIAEEFEKAIEERLRKAAEELSETTTKEVQTTSKSMEASDRVEDSNNTRLNDDDIDFLRKEGYLNRCNSVPSVLLEPRRGKFRAPKEIELRATSSRHTVQNIIASQQDMDREDVYSGELNESALGKFICGRGDVFRIEGEEKDPSLAVYIAKDDSYSMHGKKEDMAIEALAFIEDIFKPLVPLKITTFNDKRFDVIKEWDDREDTSYTYSFHAWHSPDDSNDDALAIMNGAMQLLKRPEEQKLLIMISDGLPCCSQESVHKAVEWARKKGVFVISFFIGEKKEVEEIYPNLKAMYSRYFCGVHPSILGPSLIKFLRSFIEG